MQQKRLRRSDNTRYVQESSRGPAGSASHVKAGTPGQVGASGLTQLSLEDAYTY